jgi:hypothetical protein
MRRGTLFSVAIVVLGLAILLYVLSTGGELFSFTALLGALCVVDGVLRLLTLHQKQR